MYQYVMLEQKKTYFNSCADSFVVTYVFVFSLLKINWFRYLFNLCFCSQDSIPQYTLGHSDRIGMFSCDYL